MTLDGFLIGLSFAAIALLGYFWLMRQPTKEDKSE